MHSQMRKQGVVPRKRWACAISTHAQRDHIDTHGQDTQDNDKRGNDTQQTIPAGIVLVPRRLGASPRPLGDTGGLSGAATFALAARVVKPNEDCSNCSADTLLAAVAVDP